MLLPSIVANQRQVRSNRLNGGWFGWGEAPPTSPVVDWLVWVGECGGKDKDVTYHAKRVPWVKIFDTGCLADSGRVQSWEQYGVNILEIF